MLLLPIGRDDAVVQRHAWISYAIVALNVLVYLVTFVDEQSRMPRLERQFNEAVHYVVQHPYLTVPEYLDRYLPQDVKRSVRDSNAPLPPESVRADEQAKLDELSDELQHAVGQTPARRFGYIPAHGSFIKVFTSMFLHAGFMHLLGNMLFFFVTGPFVEDVFGRPIFAFLYFAGGVVATYSEAILHPQSTLPMVGASGAIAAVMGAYLVRFAKSKLEFIWIPVLMRPTWNYRFFVPAFVVLPLWFGEQLVMAMLIKEDGGTAFAAHIGGFAFGMFVAIVVKAFDIETKYVAPVVERQTTFKADPRLEQAIAAKSMHNLAAARTGIVSLLRDDPKNVDALIVGVEVARDMNDAALLDQLAGRLLGAYVDGGQPDAARQLIDELWRDYPIPRFLGRAAAFAEREGDREWAINIVERVCGLETRGASAVGSLVKLGTLRRANGDVAGARDAFAKARAHPDCSADVAPAIDARLQQLATAERGW